MTRLPLSRYLTPTLAICSGLGCIEHSLAGEALLWQDASLTYLYGDNFQRGNNNAEEHRSQTTFTLEHASSWVWGDTFFFYDHVIGKNLQARGSNYDNLTVREKNHFYYMEFAPRISLSWLTGQDLSFGPIKDVKAAFTYEKGTGGPTTENYLYGLGLDWNVPGFTFLQTNLYRVKINNHIYFNHDYKASSVGNGYATQLTVAGAYPFGIGEQSFLIDGYIDWRSPSKDANTQNSIGSSIQIKWDAGKALFNRESKLYIGTELNLWRNKYGIKPIDGSGSGFNQTAVQALVKYHF